MTVGRPVLFSLAASRGAPRILVPRLRARLRFVAENKTEATFGSPPCIRHKSAAQVKWRLWPHAAELCPRPYGAMKPPPTLGARETTVASSLYDLMSVDARVQRNRKLIATVKTVPQKSAKRLPEQASRPRPGASTASRS